MQLLHLALKNVLRSRHRTWVTIAAMAFAGCIMIFYASLLQGWLRSMERNAVDMETGELQIHAPGFRQDPDLYNVIVDAKGVIKRASAAGFICAGRLLGSGLAAADENSTGVSIMGIDPGADDLVTRLHAHVQAGRWLSRKENNGVVIGSKLATILAVRPGSELVLVSQAADGSMANDLYTVRGVLQSVSREVDRGGLFMTAAAFRAFFVLPAGVHEIVLRRALRSESLTAATGRLRALFPNLEVKNWRQLQPTLARLLDLSNVSLVILLLITYAAVGMLTLNAMLMGVFERIPEFGVMKALGFSGSRLFGLIVLETVIQVAIGAALALVTGVPLALYFSVHPLDFSFLLRGSSTIAGIAFEPRWYCEVTGHSVLLPVLFLFGAALTAILYPAVKAAMIRPVAAIHHR
ncbi:MAG: ABC transporter permease [Deltaproteobacteria bacterium]|nr:ABC transporter permease [Deltaproteobacteria bacterium]